MLKENDPGQKKRARQGTEEIDRKPNEQEKRALRWHRIRSSSKPPRTQKERSKGSKRGRQFQHGKANETWQRRVIRWTASRKTGQEGSIERVSWNDAKTRDALHGQPKRQGEKLRPLLNTNYAGHIDGNRKRPVGKDGSAHWLEGVEHTKDVRQRKGGNTLHKDNSQAREWKSVGPVKQKELNPWGRGNPNGCNRAQISKKGTGL